MRTALAVLIGRAIRVLARLRGGGSAFPGRVALLIAPRFLQRAVERLPLGVVFVSGSNGKSTTTQMLAAIMRAHDVDVFTNPSGANLPQGIASAILADAPLDGRLRARHRGPRGRRGVRARAREATRPAQRAAHQRAGRPAEPLLRARSRRRHAGVVRRRRHAPPGRSTPMTTTWSTWLDRRRGRGAELSAFALAPELLAQSSWLARGDNPALATAGPAGGSPHDAGDRSIRTTAATIEVDGSRRRRRRPSRRAACTTPWMRGPRSRWRARCWGSGSIIAVAARGLAGHGDRLRPRRGADDAGRRRARDPHDEEPAEPAGQPRRPARAARAGLRRRRRGHARPVVGLRIGPLEDPARRCAHRHEVLAVRDPVRVRRHRGACDRARARSGAQAVPGDAEARDAAARRSSSTTSR